MIRAAISTSIVVGATVSCTRPVARDVDTGIAAQKDEPACRGAGRLVPADWVRQVSDTGSLKVAISGEYFNSRRFPTLHVTLSNPSLEGTLWVNRSMRVAPEWIPSPLHVRIRHATTGAVPTMSCSADFLPYGDYMELSPAGGCSQLVSLGCVIFRSCGPWLVQATYHDSAKELPQPPPHVEWFSGTAESNTIEVMLDKLPYPPFECPAIEPAQPEATPDAGTAGEPQP